MHYVKLKSGCGHFFAHCDNNYYGTLIPSLLVLILTRNIIIEDHNVTITCSVRGFPAPVIEWQLPNGIALNFSSTNNTRQNGSYLITSSTLTITYMTLVNEMTGEVRCIGRIPPAVTGGIVLDKVSSTATLVVHCKLLAICNTIVLSGSM